jgi:hypothetical protein
MNRRLIGLGVIGFVGAVVSAQLAVAKPVQPVNQAVNEPLCFIEHPSSQAQDLTQICGQSSLRPLLPATTIDPDAPVTFNMPRSRTPSALWNTEPDSDEPIEMGETYLTQPTAGRPTVAPPATAQSPTIAEGASLTDE